LWVKKFKNKNVQILYKKFVLEKDYEKITLPGRTLSNFYQINLSRYKVTILLLTPTKLGKIKHCKEMIGPGNFSLTKSEGK